MRFPRQIQDWPERYWINKVVGEQEVPLEVLAARRQLLFGKTIILSPRGPEYEDNDSSQVEIKERFDRRYTLTDYATRNSYEEEVRVQVLHPRGKVTVETILVDTPTRVVMKWKKELHKTIAHYQRGQILESSYVSIGREGLLFTSFWDEALADMVYDAAVQTFNNVVTELGVQNFLDVPVVGRHYKDVLPEMNAKLKFGRQK